MRKSILMFAAIVLFASNAFAQPAANVYEGEGLALRIQTQSGDRKQVTGEIVRGGERFPFTGQIEQAADAETLNGTFRTGDREFAFVATRRGQEMTFKTGDRQYELRQSNTVAAPQQFKLKTVEFRDVNMGNVVAYTMLIPDEWKSKGQIEWSKEKTPYPQTNIDATGPDNSRVAFRPAIQSLYWEFTEQAKQNMAQMGSNIPLSGGMAPPQDPGQWLAQAVAQNSNNGYTNVRLVKDNRDPEAERAREEFNRANNVPVSHEIVWEIHKATLGYEIGGVPFSEEINYSYAHSPPLNSGNMLTWTWGLYITSTVRAPSAAFAQQRPMLYAIANSLRSVPQWFTQSQILIMQITQQNIAISWKEIEERGKYYSQISDDQMKAWRKQQTPGDIAQVKRINSIYEVDDFPAPDGTSVKLPFHYQNYYSDGKGNFLMTNTSEQPTSEWSKIEPIK